MEESDEDFNSRIKNKINDRDDLQKYVENLDEFLEDYPKLYDEVLDEIVGYAARLARQAQLTISLILSNFEIRLCLEDKTKTIQLNNVHNEVNRFVMYINVNYWLSLGTINTNFDKKSAILKERITSFYLLHLLLSKDKATDLWSLSSELETTQFMDNNDLQELDPWDLDDINRMLDLEMPSDATASVYYDMLKEDIDKKSQPDSSKEDKESLEEFLKELSDSKHDGSRFEVDIKNATESEELKNNIAGILSNVQSIIKDSSDSNSKDKSWGHFSNKVQSIIEALIPPKPLANYKALLRKVVGRVKGSTRRTFSRANRRSLSSEIVLKGKKHTDNEPHILVAIDVSGSVNDDEIITALGEICHIKKGKITVIQFDTELVSKDTYTSKQWGAMLKKGYTLNARGGTLFRIPVTEFENNIFSNRNPNGYSFMIVFTDGKCAPVLPKLKNGEINTLAIKNIRWMITEFGTNSYLVPVYPKSSVIYLHNSTYKRNH